MEEILGYRITTGNLGECIQTILSWIDNGEMRRYFACANPHALEVAREDKVFEASLKSADLIVPDGIGIVIASRILGGTIRERITGYDIFWNLSKALNERGGYSCFFLGSTEENLMEITRRMAKDFPDLKVAGVYSPPFKPEFSEEDNRLMVEAVNRANPDVLWVGMTAPKQEKWIYQNKDQLDVKFMGPIGAVFDFYTGRVKRSHPFFQKMGLEWLPRFIRQPRRLWRRNLISNPAFMCRIIRARLLSTSKQSE